MFAFRRVPEDRRRRIILHLRSCATCRANVKKERLLRTALVEAFREAAAASASTHATSIDTRTRTRPKSAGWQVTKTVQQPSTQCRTFSPDPPAAGKDAQPYTASAVVWDGVHSASDWLPLTINARTRLRPTELSRFELIVTVRTEARNFVTIGV